MNKLTRSLVLLSAALSTALCGCQQLGYLGYLFAPEQKEKIKAEFTDLPGHSVAVMIFADYKMRCDQPGVEREMVAVIGSELEKKENFKDVKVIDPSKVLAFQEAHADWETMDKTQIGKELGADYVLTVAILEFTMHDPDSPNQLHGNIVAEGRLYQTRKLERDSCVWSGATVRAQFPKDKPLGEIVEDSSDDSAVRFPTEKLLAAQLVGKFYNHEVPKE